MFAKAYAQSLGAIRVRALTSGALVAEGYVSLLSASPVRPAMRNISRANLLANAFVDDGGGLARQRLLGESAKSTEEAGFMCARKAWWRANAQYRRQKIRPSWIHGWVEWPVCCWRRSASHVFDVSSTRDSRHLLQHPIVVFS
jgi:hypothetical protein